MRSYVLMSLLFHVLFIIIILWCAEPKRRTAMVNIYPVELVSIAHGMEQPGFHDIKRDNVAKSEKPRDELINVSKKVEKKPAAVKPENLTHRDQNPDIRDKNSGTSGVRIDARDFPFAYYIHILQNRIQRNWQPPYQATDQNEKMMLDIRFQVLRNGNIVDVTIEKSSGRYLFDQAAQRAVYLANPLPPLPEEFIGDRLTVHIGFEGLW